MTTKNNETMGSNEEKGIKRSYCTISDFSKVILEVRNDRDIKLSHGIVNSFKF